MTNLETIEKLKKQLEEDTESILRKWQIEGLINDLAGKTGFRFHVPRP